MNALLGRASHLCVICGRHLDKKREGEEDDEDGIFAGLGHRGHENVRFCENCLKSLEIVDGSHEGGD